MICSDDALSDFNSLFIDLNGSETILFNLMIFALFEVFIMLRLMNEYILIRIG